MVVGLSTYFFSTSSGPYFFLFWNIVFLELDPKIVFVLFLEFSNCAFWKHSRKYFLVNYYFFFYKFHYSSLKKKFKNNIHGSLIPMMENKVSELPSKIPKTLYGLFYWPIFLPSSCEWNYKYENHSISIAQVFWPLYLWRKQGKKLEREKTFVFQKEIIIMTILKLLESTPPFSSLLGQVESSFLGTQTQLLHKFYGKKWGKKIEKKKVKKINLNTKIKIF